MSEIVVEAVQVYRNYVDEGSGELLSGMHSAAMASHQTIMHQSHVSQTQVRQKSTKNQHRYRVQVCQWSMLVQT